MCPLNSEGYPERLVDSPILKCENHVIFLSYYEEEIPVTVFFMLTEVAGHFSSSTFSTAIIMIATDKRFDKQRI